MAHLNCASDQVRRLLLCERSERSLIRADENPVELGGNLLQELRDVLAAALGPGPRVGVVVEGRSHDVILPLHASLPALGVVVVRHVEPGVGGERRAQSDYRPLHGPVVARRINVIRFTSDH